MKLPTTRAVLILKMIFTKHRLFTIWGAFHYFIPFDLFENVAVCKVFLPQDCKFLDSTAI